MFTDQQLLQMLTNTEDAVVERKTWSDFRDFAKAGCAFSNSLAADQPGVLFVGVRDNGQVEDRPVNIEEKLKIVSGELSNVFPAILPTVLALEKDGRPFIAAVIYGSRNKPHFAAHSWIRKGTETVDASEDNLRRFIAERSGKVAEILKWKDQIVIVNILQPPDVHHRVGRIASSMRTFVLDCNEHWVIVGDREALPNRSTNCFTLSRVSLSFDVGTNKLVLEVSTE
ncbi:MAG: ATP-binding protein [Candidatus Acidiferrum sp.]|jgi:hypothetical protein